MEPFSCRICGNEKNNRGYLLKEMMFGFRDEFKYVKCANCGCLQIEEIPHNVEKYYPPNYYSFNTKENYLNKFFNKKRDQYSLGQKSFLGKLLIKKYGHSPLYTWLREIELNPTDKILDVGCGEGELLKKLAGWGLNNLVGIDPHISEDRIYNSKVRIMKQNINSLTEGQFDLIMLHHSFEHMDKPHETLVRINQLLKKNKYLLIRIPVIDTAAWQKFNTNWVQLDAPRHYYLHSVNSINYLAEKTGFKLHKTIFDSTAFQFWGSEQYQKDIPLCSENSFMVNPSKSIFDASTILEYEKRTEELNEMGQGDQAAFYLVKNT